MNEHISTCGNSKRGCYRDRGQYRDIGLYNTSSHATLCVTPCAILHKCNIYFYIYIDTYIRKRTEDLGYSQEFIKDSLNPMHVFNSHLKKVLANCHILTLYNLKHATFNFFSSNFEYFQLKALYHVGHVSKYPYLFFATTHVYAKRDIDLKFWEIFF